MLLAPLFSNKTSEGTIWVAIHVQVLGSRHVEV
jgi:hypothetical protein